MCAVLQHYQAARLARSSVSIGAPRIIRPLRAAGMLRGSSGSQMCAVLRHYQAARLARSSVSIGAPRVIRPLRAAGMLRGSSGSQMRAVLQHYQAARLARSSLERGQWGSARNRTVPKSGARWGSGSGPAPQSAPFCSGPLWCALVGCCVVGSWSTGVLEYWGTGVLDYWNTRELGYWSTGVLEYWGPTALSPIGQRPGYMGMVGERAAGFTPQQNGSEVGGALG